MVLVGGGGSYLIIPPLLVFFLCSNHHYLDKLLTLPEKLNYINNSTKKILSPPEKSTAANKNLPDFHQATWTWMSVMYDCVVLPEILSSVLLLLCVFISMYISFSPLFRSPNRSIYVFPECIVCHSSMKPRLFSHIQPSLFLTYHG